MTHALLALAVTLAAPGPKDPPPKGPPSLVGEWVVQNRLVGGKADDVPAGATMTFREDGTTDYLGLARSPATFKVNTARTPAEVDFLPPPVSSAPGQFGIFKVDGDTLTLCLVGAGDRPTRFESPTGSRVRLVVLRRAGAKE
jgi:uncharacterized protein (TIGR03067 family)